MSEIAAARREPWESLSRQKEASSLGLWCFIATELLFFGGMLLGYAVYRHGYPEAFAAAGRETNVFYGTLNTAVLMTSSLTMALAVRGAEAKLRRLALWSLAGTILLGFAFLGIKGLEYREDINKHLVPGPDFKLAELPAQIFFAFYWVMTAVHAVHLTIGIGLVARLFLQGATHDVPLETSPQIEVTALYWHLVDTIWIVLYPLLYLYGRAT
jgi:cytochrome c oxidase subunit III